MKIKEVNYHGFDHDTVNKNFGGDLTYIGDICLNDTKVCVAVYKAASPDRSKGHKDYMMLSAKFVGGLTLQEFKKEAKHGAILCTNCDTVLYSLNRHNFNQCDCDNETFIDGGKDYERYGGIKLDKITHGVYNVYTGKFRKQRNKT